MRKTRGVARHHWTGRPGHGQRARPVLRVATDLPWCEKPRGVRLASSHLGLPPDRWRTPEGASGHAGDGGGPDRPWVDHGGGAERSRAPRLARPARAATDWGHCVALSYTLSRDTTWQSGHSTINRQRGRNATEQRKQHKGDAEFIHHPFSFQMGDDSRRG